MTRLYHPQQILQVGSAFSKLLLFIFFPVFTPVFNLVDEATLNTRLFPGHFSLIIIAAGRSLDHLRNFNIDEQSRFNLQAG